MLVKDIMTPEVKCIPADTNLEQAAKIMAHFDCGFLPVTEDSDKNLIGVVTDRDIVIRGIANGGSPQQMTVGEVRTNATYCCLENDDVESAAEAMRHQCVYRLLVLNNEEERILCGVISLGDISRHQQETLAGKVASRISAGAA